MNISEEIFINPSTILSHKRVRMMNKKLGIFSVFIITIVLSAFMVSAATGLVDIVKSFVDGTITLIKPYAGVLLNETDTAATNDIFMGKILMIILIVSIVFVVLERSMKNVFGDRRWALWVVSIVVGLIGVRFLPGELVQMVFLSSNAFAVTISAGLPFVLFFFLVKDFESKTARRVAWIFFAVVFLAIYEYRYDSLGDFAYIYPLVALLAFLVAVFDGTIQGFFATMKAEKLSKIHMGGAALVLKKKIADITAIYEGNTSAYQGGLVDPTHASTRTETGTSAYVKDIDYLEKEVRRLLK
jgi:hypothetical protein